MTTWTIIDVTTNSKYQHKGCTPGKRAAYRIRAKRGDKTSGYSNAAAVYSAT